MSAQGLRRPLLFGWPARWFETVLPEGDSAGDLPAAADPRAQLPRVASWLAALTIPVVALTAGSQVGRGYAYSDIVTLLVVFGLATLGLHRIPWLRIGPAWLLGIVAVQVVFVTCLDTLTGGGASPYLVIYAPILAAAGWFLGPVEVTLAVAIVVGTEVWRSFAIAAAGTVPNVLIALPFLAVLAGLSFLTARRLGAALATIRRDQVLTAATLEAIRRLGSEMPTGALQHCASTAERIFRARCQLVELGPSSFDGGSLQLVSENGHIAAPIGHDGRIVAILQLWRDAPFSATEVRLCGLLAEVTGTAVEMRRALHEVRRESERDDLTGLFNRRVFDRDRRLAGDAVNAFGGSITLLFIDLDHFKRINDLEGHQQGDLILRHVGAMLAGVVRRNDVAYRIGGDEFALLARDLTDEGAQELGNRVRTAIGRPRRRAGESDPPTAVTVSVGIATHRGAGCDPDLIMAAADRAMYAAKSSQSGVAVG